MLSEEKMLESCQSGHVLSRFEYQGKYGQSQILNYCFLCIVELPLLHASIFVPYES